MAAAGKPEVYNFEISDKNFDELVLYKLTQTASVCSVYESCQHAFSGDGKCTNRLRQ